MLLCYCLPTLKDLRRGINNRQNKKYIEPLTIINIPPGTTKSPKNPKRLRPKGIVAVQKRDKIEKTLPLKDSLTDL